MTIHRQGEPVVSVLLANCNQAPALERCLDSLANQTLRDVEIIVAVVFGEIGEYRRRYPAVQFLACESSLDEPQQLKMAIEQARGGIVVVSNTHCIFPPDWLEKLWRAHDSDFAVIGGAVEHGGPDTLVAWSCYLADYGAFLPSAKRRTMPVLAGNHISYKRDILEKAADSLRHGYWKVFLLQDLSRLGVPFLFDPELVVRCIQEKSFGEFAAGYYRNARRFAAARARSFSWGARLAHIVTAPALPGLLLYRRVRGVRDAPIPRGRLLAALALLATLMVCWSAGEFAGYVRGEQLPRR